MTTSYLPWCHECECYSVPDDSGECGECGSDVEILEADG
jgi:predicted RNA-binding protein with PUA domain